MGIKNLTEAEEKEFYRLVEKMNGKEPEKKQDVKVKKPEIGTRYFYLDSVGDIVNAVWDDDEYDNARWDLGKVFLTEKEIVFAIEKRKVEVELERYAKEHNDPERDVWNGFNERCGIRYDCLRGDLDTSTMYQFRDIGAIYFTSKEIAEDAANKVGAKRIMKYLFDVDCEVDE
jgi:hypothetical protein